MEFEYTIGPEDLAEHLHLSIRANEESRATARSLYQKGLSNLAFGFWVLLAAAGLWVLQLTGKFPFGVAAALLLMPLAGSFIFISLQHLGAVKRRADGRTVVSGALLRVATSSDAVRRKTGRVRARLDDAGLTTGMHGESHTIGTDAVDDVHETEKYLCVRSRAGWNVFIPKDKVDPEVLAKMKRVVAGWGKWNETAAPVLSGS